LTNTSGSMKAEKFLRLRRMSLVDFQTHTRSGSSAAIHVFVVAFRVGHRTVVRQYFISFARLPAVTTCVPSRNDAR
jgi:hypothetical protein